MADFFGGIDFCSSDATYYERANADHVEAEPVLERTGVSDLEPGWLVCNTTARKAFYCRAASNPVDLAYNWVFGYGHPVTLTSGGWVSIYEWEVANSAGANKIFSFDQFEDAGTYKYRLRNRTDGTTLATGSNTFSLETTVTYCMKLFRDTATPTNSVYTLYVNGTSEVTWTVTSSFVTGGSHLSSFGDPDDGGGSGGSGLNQTSFDLGVCSDTSQLMYLAEYMTRGSTTDDEDETLKPECHGHIATGNGFYDDFGDQGATTPGLADFTDVDDLAAAGNVDDGTTAWQAVNDADPERQTVTIGGSTYTNGIVGVMESGRLRATAVAKTVPHRILWRLSSTDATRILDGVELDVYAYFAGSFTADPSGGAISEADIEGGDWGWYRSPASANLVITATLVTGWALGATSKAPPDPPAAAGEDRRRLLSGCV